MLPKAHAGRGSNRISVSSNSSARAQVSLSCSSLKPGMVLSFNTNVSQGVLSATNRRKTLVVLVVVTSHISRVEQDVVVLLLHSLADAGFDRSLFRRFLVRHQSSRLFLNRGSGTR